MVLIEVQQPKLTEVNPYFGVQMSTLYSLIHFLAFLLVLLTAVEKSSDDDFRYLVWDLTSGPDSLNMMNAEILKIVGPARRGHHRWEWGPGGNAPPIRGHRNDFGFKKNGKTITSN